MAISAALQRANELLNQRRTNGAVVVAPAAERQPRAAVQQLAAHRERVRPTGIVDNINSSSQWLAPLAQQATGNRQQVTDNVSSQPPAPSPQLEIPTFPTLNTAAIKAGEVRIYRAWLILWHNYLRHGRQKITRDELTALLCDDITTRCFGRRRWHTIRTAGHNAYWARSADGDLFIYGLRQVCQHLRVPRLVGRRVLIEQHQLVKSTANAKKYLYASVHASAEGMPISRDAISAETGISRYQQWRIEQQATAWNTAPAANLDANRQTKPLISAQRNIELTTLDSQAAAYRWQQAAFTFTDQLGKQGQRGQTYAARVLPNSYSTSLRSIPANSTQKRINKLLRPQSRATMGSAGTTAKSEYEPFERMYYSTAADAARAVDQQQVQHAVYKTPVQSHNKTIQFWHSFLFDRSETRYWGSRPPSSADAGPVSQGRLPIA